MPGALKRREAPTLTMRERFAPSRPFKRYPKRRRRAQLAGRAENQSGQRFLADSAPRLRQLDTSCEISSSHHPSPLAGKGKKSARGGGAEPHIGRNAPASLDTVKHLATSSSKLGGCASEPSLLSVADWNDSQMTVHDYSSQQWALHRELINSVWEIWQAHARRPKDDGEQVWWDAYEAALKALPDESTEQRWARVEKWLKANKAKGRNADRLKWEKTWMQLERCQTEFVGHRAACCPDRTRPVAVPIGCNHRLCPLCAYIRTQAARVRIMSMFDKLANPVFITLTVPNYSSLSKPDYGVFRERVRVLLDGYKGWIVGGVYSIETTYNRREKSWHIHAHILCDASAALPGPSQKFDFFGWRTFAFTAIKQRMEFDWLRLWRTDCGKAPWKNASKATIDKDRRQFERWVRRGREMALREYVGRKWQPIAGLSAEETALRTEWNRNYRRVIDIRGVDDREKAAREVLKYITKGAQFSDNPGADPRTGLGGAVEMFCDATKGARFVQTFGTWYGAQFDTNFDVDHLDDWGERKCTCGLNMWERMGVFHRGDVVMDEAGRWHLRAPLDHRCRGTVARPTIRALDARQE